MSTEAISDPTPKPVAAERRGRWRTLLALASGYFIDQGEGQAMSVLFPAIRDALDFGYAGLGQIAGALSVATQEDVSRLTEKLERALNAAFAGSEDGEVANLVPLSDAVAALELYLTGCRDHQSGNQRYRDVMAERLEGLPEAAGDGSGVSLMALPPLISVDSCACSGRANQKPMSR